MNVCIGSAALAGPRRTQNERAKSCSRQAWKPDKWHSPPAVKAASSAPTLASVSAVKSVLSFPLAIVVVPVVVVVGSLRARTKTITRLASEVRTSAGSFLFAFRPRPAGLKEANQPRRPSRSPVAHLGWQRATGDVAGLCNLQLASPMCVCVAANET